MVWAMLDDHYGEESAPLSDAEFRTHTEALVWVMDHDNVSGGLITERDLRRFAETPDPLKAVAGLVDKGWWETRDDGASWQMLRDIGRQRSAERIAADKAANAARQARSRERQRNGVTNAVSHDERNASHNGVSNAYRTEPTSSTTGGLFSTGSSDLEVKEGKARNAVSNGVTPQRQDLTITQRSKIITDAYAAAEPMCKWPAVNGVVIKAIKSERFADDEIQAALLRLAKEGRGVTVETLRVELAGLTPRPSAPRQSKADESLARAEQMKARGRVDSGQHPGAIPGEVIP